MRSARPAMSGASARARARYSADRKSTRLNSSHANISYAVFCLKKKNDHADADSVSLSTSLVEYLAFGTGAAMIEKIPDGMSTSGYQPKPTHETSLEPHESDVSV